ncbi:aldo/keto reductase [Mucilaginibacter sp. KACC 22063]|uniref:aldo/keto reductase n=1 Tax=Mucilaginibacter sp. KACC 22063 TaxID=3025666 RepID=UPI00236736A4|nr:aldo/keto reductase [Mucilaginibacter sp. KACC 22063]WDF57087.1 aldo/keto reductase [Mucilaginibacter sp. KACC 22063]
MEYRKLGRTDLEVSVITFGAWAAGGWMWGGNDDNDAIGAMHAAYDLGITSIDTAPIYGQGKSEELVGQAIKDFPRDKVQILTKYGMRWDDNKGQLAFKSKDNSGKPIDIYKYAGRDSVIMECENSLKRLGTDYIDLYQIHWPDVTTPIDETMEAVLMLKEQGKIREAGVCNYDAQQMQEAEKTISLASNQVPFSMVNRGIQNELIPHCIEHNKSILAYSPLERGLLTGKMKPGQEFGEGDHRAGVKYFKDENIKRTNDFLQKIKHIADDKNATLGQLVLRWTVEHPGITIALVGARNADQAKQNAKAIEVKLTAEEIDFINQQLDQLQIID